MYPQILYWKWNDEMLEEGLMEAKVQDIIDRSCFTDIYVAPHSMFTRESTLTGSIMHEKIKKLNEILNKNGRRLIMDIDIRREPGVYAKISNELSYFVSQMDVDLDADGKAFVEIPKNTYAPPRRVEDDSYVAVADYNFVDSILGAYAVDMVSEGVFKKDTFTNIIDKVELSSEGDQSYLTIDAGKENANRHCYFFVSYCIRMPDWMSEEFLQGEQVMIEALNDIPLSGVCLDEWGLSVFMQNGYSMGLYYSRGMVEKYEKYCGRKFLDDLPYFYYSPEGELDKSIRTVNAYFDVIRQQTVKGEQTLYDLTKKYFGKDAFVGCHPTWWGSKFSLLLEGFHNGLNWWEVPRDYAQTDEVVSIPIRNSMARLCPKPVWYNMWYSQRTLDIKTYFTETWTNARFGGRTHHLGYECYEPGVVLTLKEEGRLEQISEMEEQIKKLNSFQKALPDARVLCLFGMQSYLNWHYSNHGKTTISSKLSNYTDPLKFSNILFDKNVLHDFTPTSEIDRGTLKLEGDKVVYNGHTYDAVIVINPDGCSKSVIDFIDNYAEKNGNLIVIGSINRLDDGTEISHEFNTKYSFKEIPEVDEVIAILDELKIARNMTDKLCVFTDKSVIASTSGDKNVGNELKVDFEVDGHSVSFDGTDFVAVRIENGQPDVRFGTAKKFTIDGKSML